MRDPALEPGHARPLHMDGLQSARAPVEMDIRVGWSGECRASGVLGLEDSAMVIIGVDPGLTGAICVIGPGWQEIIDLPVCPNGQQTGSMRNWLDVAALNETLLTLSYRRNLSKEAVPYVFIERPIAMASLPAQTIASQFDTFGALRAIFERQNIVDVVNPRVWKRIYAVGADKEKARDTAAALYPNLAPMLKRVKDHNRADSVLIAHYGLKEMQ